MANKVLKAVYHPKELEHLPFLMFKVEDLRILPSQEWIVNRSNQFGYTDSFDNAGMQYPIAVSTSDPAWVKERILLKNAEGQYKNPHHLTEEKTLIPGMYTHVGNKRVLYAQQKGYTHIEGYLITSPQERELVRLTTLIPHEKIPK